MVAKGVGVLNIPHSHDGNGNPLPPREWTDPQLRRRCEDGVLRHFHPKQIPPPVPILDADEDEDCDFYVIADDTCDCERTLARCRGECTDNK